jgi:hypothetical protein
MEAEGVDRETILQDIHDTITLPASRFKEAISARIIHFDEFMQQYAGDLLLTQALQVLRQS